MLKVGDICVNSFGEENLIASLTNCSDKAEQFLFENVDCYVEISDSPQIVIVQTSFTPKADSDFFDRESWLPFEIKVILDAHRTKGGFISIGEMQHKCNAKGYSFTIKSGVPENLKPTFQNRLRSC